MTRSFRKISKAVSALFALLLVGGAVAFAQHNITLNQILGGSAKTEVLAATRGVQQMATNRPLVKVFLSGAIERGSKKIAVEKAGPVSPGEVVSYTIYSVNEGSAAAREYKAVGQVPRNATFVEGSAVGSNSQVSYSIDNGQQFSPQPKIDQKQADGTMKKVAAPVSMYTQVRFAWADPLVAGGKVAASYQVRVK